MTTIVVISHNYGRFLRDAVVSVVQQTKRAHILIIDDASTDETPHVIEALESQDPAIAHQRLPRNIGLARVRNLAAAAARTDWVVYLDADDWLDPRFVERAEARLKVAPGVDVLTTDMTIVREHQRRRVVRSRVPLYWDELLARNTIVQTSLIRRSLVRQLGGYDESLDFEDWDFWIRALQAGARIARLPGPHVFRREHGQNKSKLCDERAAAAAVRRKHAATASAQHEK